MEIKKYATEEFVDNKIKIGLQPPPKVTAYTKPTSIPLVSGTQLIFYGSTAGTMKFKLGSKTYSHRLESMDDVGWVIWVQSSSIDGSIISHTGRNYFDIGETITTTNVEWVPDGAPSSPNWIVITIT